jgi:ribosomal protein L37E
MVLGWIRPAASTESSLVECRRCGTTLDDGAGVCTECGSHELARYTF